MRTVAVLLALASRVLFSFTDPAITESSGLVDLGGLMVTTNDSGDAAMLYVVDPRTGATVGRTRYAAAVTDVEALAPAGRGQVWAADIGDNDAVRSGVEVYRVPVGRGERTVAAPAYRLAYPDGAHDAESLLWARGRLWIVTKGILGGGVYATRGPLHEDRVNRLVAVGAVSQWATDAALLPGGRYALVRGYDSADLVTFPGFRTVTTIGLPAQQQGEGISVGPGGRVRLSSEGAHSPVLQITLPARVRALLAPPVTRTPHPTATARAAGQSHRQPGGSGPSSGALALGAGGVLLVLVAGWVLTGRRRAR